MKTYKVPVAVTLLVAMVCAAGTVWGQDVAAGYDLLRTVEQVTITFGEGQKCRLFLLTFSDRVLIRLRGR